MSAGIAPHQFQHRSADGSKQRGRYARRQRNAERVTVPCAILNGDQSLLTCDLHFEQPLNAEQAVEVLEQIGVHESDAPFLLA